MIITLKFYENAFSRPIVVTFHLILAKKLTTTQVHLTECLDFLLYMFTFWKEEDYQEINQLAMNGR